LSELLEGKTILIVDDDRDILTAIQQAVEDAGGDTLTAEDGNKAVEVAERDQPDLIILDAMLPKRSGFLVMEKLRNSMEPEIRPKIIMITGNPGKRHQEWATSLGANAFINKPFRMDKLIQTAGELLS
jgi:DNA-binding response OmpR family regulator